MFTVLFTGVSHVYGDAMGHVTVKMGLTNQRHVVSLFDLTCTLFYVVLIIVAFCSVTSGWLYVRADVVQRV